MKTKTAIAIGFVALLFAASYLFTVGVVWLIQYLVNLLFSTQFDLNVWIGGVLLYVVLLVFKK